MFVGNVEKCKSLFKVIIKIAHISAICYFGVKIVLTSFLHWIITQFSVYSRLKNGSDLQTCKATLCAFKFLIFLRQTIRLLQSSLSQTRRWVY